MTFETIESMLVGYARVSTSDQTLNLQKDALEKIVNAYLIAVICTDDHILFDFMAVVVGILCVFFCESPWFRFCLKIGCKAHPFACGARCGDLLSCGLQYFFNFIQNAHTEIFYQSACCQFAFFSRSRITWQYRHSSCSALILHQTWRHCSFPFRLLPKNPP